MKKSILALAALAAISGTASAQSNITMYGVIDTAVRYTSNQQVDPTCTVGCKLGSQTVLTEGAFQGPRIGFKGSEDLGGGTYAIFQLENGFFSNNGTFDQQGQLFGRQEFVGLKDTTWGELDAGRQYGAAFDLLGNYDPLGIGNFNENEWGAFIYGLRFDNTLKYTKSFGPVTAEVTYSLGGQAGTNSIGRTVGGALSYTQGPLSFGGVVQNSTDANNAKLKVAGLGGSFVAGPATLYLQYFEAKRDPNFAKGDSGTAQPLANTSLIYNVSPFERKDDMWTTGVLYQATPALGFTLGYMYDSIKGADATTGNSGKMSTAYAIADYNLSKRTDVYAAIDRTKLSGGELNDVNGVFSASFLDVPLGDASSRTGLAIGLRHKF